ncbi:MAG: ABC transporter permease, partial [Symploca sp. SIO2G7]|nr:ABC transporter permease [Symploca sp. SIO2G7]
GMVLGNAITGTSLALDRFLNDLTTNRGQVEALLALGATRWEAAHTTVTEALRTGMIPTINSMMVMGLVSLPGMMTGQILAGALPTNAVRYQIVIIFTIAAGTALASLGIILLAFRALFSQQHQLRLERLHSKDDLVRNSHAEKKWLNLRRVISYLKSRQGLGSREEWSSK